MRILLSVVIVFFLCSTAIFAYDYFSAGKNAYSQNDMRKANYYFKKTLEVSPNNIDARYYYAQTFVELKYFKKAQKEYEKIIEVAPTSKTAQLAGVALSNIYRYDLMKRGISPGYVNTNSKITTNYSRVDSYIDNALDSGKVVHWDIKQMPIKVYIERNAGDPGYQDYYFAAVKSAFDNWVKSLDSSNLSYILVDNYEQADIRVFFESEVLKKTGKEYISGLATPYMQGDILKYFDIKLKSNKPNGKSFSQKEMYFTALHEIGHSLGLAGHSSKAGDIMYSSAGAALSNQDTGLSSRDVNTINLLYKLVPDISNFKNGKKPRTNPGINDSILGSKDDRLQKELQEAIEYTEKYPKNILSWMQLGKIYSELEDYEKSIISYNKVLQLDPGYKNAMEQLAFLYQKLSKTKEAAGYYSQLVALEPTNVNYSYNYALFLTENKQYSGAYSVVQKILSINPQARSHSGISELSAYLQKYR